MITLCEQLLTKSQEAFILSIEIYNKPTIRYRVEGFSFLICNAWELMLKAHIINKHGEEEIYFPDTKRTISLEGCLKKVFTNENTPMRKNLEKIIDLRNTSAHFVTEEYEVIYFPLFQSCVLNYVEKMREYHSIDVEKIIPQSFLNLIVSMRPINNAEIRSKYPSSISEKLLATNEAISEMIKDNNQHFAIRIEHQVFITKDKDKADTVMHFDKDAEKGATIIRELKDPSDTHKYTCKACVREINHRLHKRGISFVFNAYHFNLFCKRYGIKENEKLCYEYRNYKVPTYGYSIHVIELIFEMIQDDPVLAIEKLKVKNKS